MEKNDCFLMVLIAPFREKPIAENGPEISATITLGRLSYEPGCRGVRIAVGFGVYD